MNFFRVGIVDFFGIVCPGVLLLINLTALLFICGVDVKSLWNLTSRAEPGTDFILFLLFVISYLFGFILRLIPPNSVDNFSSKFKMRVP